MAKNAKQFEMFRQNRFLKIQRNEIYPILSFTSDLMLNLLMFVEEITYETERVIQFNIEKCKTIQSISGKSIFKFKN